MAYPSPTTAISVPGSATPTYLASSLSGSWTSGQTFTLNSVTSWQEVGSNGQATTNPLGTSGLFVVVVDFGLSTEEHILCSAINNSTGVVTVWTDGGGTLNGRGWDGTTISAHSAGSAGNLNCFPIIGGTFFAGLNSAIPSTSSAVANISLTGQSAAISNTTIYTPLTAGFYVVNYYGKVTTAATTSSTLGPFQVTSIDPDGNTVVSVGDSSSQNSATTAFINGTIIVYSNGASPIQYSMGYTSSGATAMSYELYVNVLSSNTNILNAVQNVAGKNVVINGAMEFWQRGTSFSSGTNAQYLVDRWCAWGGWTTAGAYTVSRQSSIGLAGFQYATRFQRVNGSSNTTPPFLGQSLESANSIPYAGQQVTLSFYARAGADFSSTSKVFTAQVISSTGTDQNIATSYAPQYTAISQGAVLTTSWQRFVFSGTLSSLTTEFAVQFQYTPTGTAGANDYYDITGVQIELGGAATVFSRSAGSYASEFMACQRYYAVLGNADLQGQIYATNDAVMWAKLPVQMRIGANASATASTTTTPPSSGYIAVTSLSANINLFGTGSITPTGNWQVSAAYPTNIVLYNTSLPSGTQYSYINWGSGNVMISAEI